MSSVLVRILIGVIILGGLVSIAGAFFGGNDVELAFGNPVSLDIGDVGEGTGILVVAASLWVLIQRFGDLKGDVGEIKDDLKELVKEMKENNRIQAEQWFRHLEDHPRKDKKD